MVANIVGGDVLFVAGPTKGGCATFHCRVMTAAQAGGVVMGPPPPPAGRHARTARRDLARQSRGRQSVGHAPRK